MNVSWKSYAMYPSKGNLELENEIKDLVWLQRTPRHKGMIFQGDESVAADFPMKSPEESKNLTSSTQRKPDHDPQMRAGPKQTETNLGAQEQIDQGTNCLTASVLFNHCILSVWIELPFFI